MDKLFYVPSLCLTFSDDFVFVDVHKVHISDVGSDDEGVPAVLVAEGRNCGLRVHFLDGQTAEMIEITVKVSFKDSDLPIEGSTKHHLFPILLFNQNVCDIHPVFVKFFD